MRDFVLWVRNRWEDGIQGMLDRAVLVQGHNQTCATIDEMFIGPHICCYTWTFWSTANCQSSQLFGPSIRVSILRSAFSTLLHLFQGLLLPQVPSNLLYKCLQSYFSHDQSNSFFFFCILHLTPLTYKFSLSRLALCHIRMSILIAFLSLQVLYIRGPLLINM